MKKTFVLGAILAAALLLLNCAEEGNAEQPDEPVKKGTPVKTLTLAPQTFSNYLTVMGTVKSRNHIDITVEEAGTLSKILVDKGEDAKAGQTLAVLEEKVLEATYKQAQASLNQAELDYNSKKVLHEKRAISENEYLTAKYNLDAAQAAHELTKARYEKLFIKAPINGIVNNRYYDLGAYARPGTPIFEYIDIDHLKVRAGVAERFMGDIETGTPVEITFDAYPELKFEAKISFVSRSIDPQNRTFEIEIDIPNEHRKLAPRMVANIKILRQSFQDRIVVPLDALIESENGWYVFVDENQHAKKVYVQQAAIYQDRVLVEGLQAGQQLIVVGHRELSEGDSVQIVPN